MIHQELVPEKWNVLLEEKEIKVFIIKKKLKKVILNVKNVDQKCKCIKCKHVQLMNQ